MDRTLPSGTVTFLITDIEGSTALWEEHGEDMRAALAHHDQRLRAVITGRGGVVFKHTGDGLCSAFGDAGSAVLAAVEAQQALADQDWGPVGDLRVRIGLHTGEAEPDGRDYHASAVNRAARIENAATGGQILVSDATRALADGVLDDGLDAVDLGEHELRGLARPVRLHQVLHPDLDTALPPLRAAPRLLGNLPEKAGELIGRDDALTRIVGAVTPGSLLTLTGVGGVGKTSLALEAARRLSSRHEAGAWLVELAPLTDPGDVADTVLLTLGIKKEAGTASLAGLLAALQSRARLIVLDNCEHLLDTVADLADAILSACPDVALIATSREPLGAAAEEIRPIRSLALPTDDTSATESPAVELFLQRARSAGGTIPADPGALAAVADICRRLDGIPLAIELAAARTRSMGLEDIVERLDERFRLLTGGRRTAVERHQTLRAAVEWSYRLLDEPTQALFERLSVFAGPFDLDAAETVGSGPEVADHEVLDLLADLVDKSMVVSNTSEGQARYHLLETLRQYGAEQLDERGRGDDARRRHVDWLLGRFRALNETTATTSELSARQEWRSGIDDFRAAFHWVAGRRDVTTLAALFASCVDLAASDPDVDLADLALTALDLGLDETVPDACAVMALLAVSPLTHGHAEMMSYARRGLAVVGPEPLRGKGWCYSMAVNQAYRSGDVTAGERLADEWIAYVEEHAGFGLPLALGLSSLQAHYSGNGERSAALLARADALDLVGSARGFLQFVRAEIHSEDDPDQALADYRAAIRNGREQGNVTEMLALSGEAALLARVGEDDEALAGFQHLFGYWRDRDAGQVIWVTVRNLVDLLARLGEDEVAARLHGRLADTQQREVTASQQVTLDDLGARMGADAFAAAMASGTGLSPREAMDLALDTIARLRA